MPTIAISLPQPAVKAGKFELLPDGERTKLERQAERVLSEALAAWGNALLRGITAGNVQAVLARLDNPTWPGNIAMRDALIAVLQQAADVGVEYGRQQIEAVVYGVKFTIPSLGDIDWELANADAAKWATDYGYQLIRGIQDATRRIVANEIVYFVDNSLTINQLRDRIVSATGGAFSKARARRIAVTETTRAYAEGNIAAWDRSGVVEGKEWYTAVDELVCPLCAPMHGQVVPIKGTFSDGSNGPPRHVNCRCNVLPVVMGDTGEGLTQWRPVLDDGGRVLDWVEGGGGGQQVARQFFTRAEDARAAMEKLASSDADRAAQMRAEMDAHHAKEVAPALDKMLAEARRLDAAGIFDMEDMMKDPAYRRAREAYEAASANRQVMIDNLYDFEKAQAARLRPLLHVDSPASLIFEFADDLTQAEIAQYRAALDDVQKMIAETRYTENRTVTVRRALPGHRSNYSDGQLWMEAGAKGRTAAHELGHFLEDYDLGMRNRSLDWRNRRTEGEGLQRLADLFPDHNYRPDEVTRPDEFFHPYVGKNYKARATEVVSMGLEMFYSDPLKLARDDRDMFDFIFNTLRWR